MRGLVGGGEEGSKTWEACRGLNGCNLQKIKRTDGINFLFSLRFVELEGRDLFEL